jgi:acetyl esterase/lipase
MTRRLTSLLLLLILLFPAALLPAADGDFKRTTDVVYGRKFGTALTMDVFTPSANANGIGIIYVVSGGWFSNHDGINGGLVMPSIKELTSRGYTVFAVVHGSQPKFTIPEILQDMHRAVRYIRAHAKDYGIDPERIGIAGASAGGHLSLMQGTAGTMGDPKAKDPIDRLSSRVQAVACFFPPTDFLNYGDKDKIAFAPNGTLAGFRSAVDVREPDPKTRLLERVTDEKKLTEMWRQISPVTHVTKESAPSFIIHGDKDFLVPLQQAEAIVAKLKEAGVPAELSIKKGAGHGWPDIAKDVPSLADWFDKQLKKK